MTAKNRRLFAWTLGTAGVLCAAVFVRLTFLMIFGYVPPGIPRRWDGMRSPDIRDSKALLSVSNFISANGPNMQTNGWVFEEESVGPRPIKGLPWKSIKDLELSAVTLNDILYVRFGGWHHDSYGVAWNPKTNKFPLSIRSFKPVGDHWYVWLQPEFQSNGGPQEYE